MAYPGIGWASRPAGSIAPVVVYGTRWCAASQMVRRYLDRLGIPYHYVDLELDDRATTELARLTGGYASHPTVSVGGQLLVEPSLGELDRALAAAGILRRGWW